MISLTRLVKIRNSISKIKSLKPVIYFSTTSTDHSKHTDSANEISKSNEKIDTLDIKTDSNLSSSIETEFSVIEEFLSIDTILATAGCEVSDFSTGAVTPPIHLSTTFERDENLTLSKGFCYSRSSNPTRLLLETTFVKLENGKEAFAFSSGMQAAYSIIMTSPGSHILLPDDLYHGVLHMLLDIFSKWGITFEKIDMSNCKVVKDKLKSIKESLKNKDILIWLETPSNPQCKVTDVETIVLSARKILADQNYCVIVDSTWATPFLLKPLELGADFVIHSTTKYIGGHSDMLGGIAVAGNIN